MFKKTDDLVWEGVPKDDNDDDGDDTKDGDDDGDDSKLVRMMMI